MQDFSVNETDLMTILAKVSERKEQDKLIQTMQIRIKTDNLNNMDRKINSNPALFASEEEIDDDSKNFFNFFIK